MNIYKPYYLKSLNIYNNTFDFDFYEYPDKIAYIDYNNILLKTYPITLLEKILQIPYDSCSMMKYIETRIV